MMLVANICRVIWSDRGTIDAIGNLVQTASIAEVVVVSISSPERRGDGTAVGAFSTL